MGQLVSFRDSKCFSNFHLVTSPFLSIIMLKYLMLISLFCSSTFCKCSVDKEVRFILKNMNPTSVEREVDCVVGIGSCDNLGVRLKAEAPSAVRQGRCGKRCSCEQIQVRLVVNKMKRNYPGQWRRVESKFG